MNFVNCTPHPIALNNGTVYSPSDNVARVAVKFGDFVDGVCHQTYGDVQNLPAPADGVTYIVSALVLSALNGSRADVVAPATGHPDCKRSDKGFIISVPGFVR